MKLLKILLLITFCISSIHSFPFEKSAFQNIEDEIQLNHLTKASFKYRASSCFENFYCASNLFDSNESTYWKTTHQDLEEKIEIDFGTKRLMNYVEVDFYDKESRTPFFVQVTHRNNYITISQTLQPYLKNKIHIGDVDASMLRFVFKKHKHGSIKISNLKIKLNHSNLTGIDSYLSNYIFPIQNSFLPDDDSILPGAPRKYRNGIHKGIDIFYKWNKENEKYLLNKNDEVKSIGDGIIIRADLNYSPMTIEEYDEITNYNQTNPVTYVSKDFGGRQIWIDHQNGVMSSYNHLSSIENGIAVGKKIIRGEIIGKVGNSGLRGEALNNNSGIHLHLEIWVNGEYAGKDLSANQSRKFLEYFFRRE